MTTNEIALNSNDNLTAISSVQNAINGMKHGSSNVLSTFTGDDFDSRVQVIAAMTSAVPLADNLGTVINLANVVIQAIEMEDETTKKMVEVPRIVLVDDKGVSYAAISNGIFKSLENIFGILGQPESWGRPLPVVAAEKRSRNGFRFMTLEIAPSTPAKK